MAGRGEEGAGVAVGALGGCGSAGGWRGEVGWVWVWVWAGFYEGENFVDGFGHVFSFSAYFDVSVSCGDVAGWRDVDFYAVFGGGFLELVCVGAVFVVGEVSEGSH